MERIASRKSRTGRVLVVSHHGPAALSGAAALGFCLSCCLWPLLGLRPLALAGTWAFITENHHCVHAALNHVRVLAPEALGVVKILGPSQHTWGLFQSVSYLAYMCASVHVFQFHFLLSSAKSHWIECRIFIGYQSLLKSVEVRI